MTILKVYKFKHWQKTFCTIIRMASEAEDDSEAAVEEPPALSDSGLEESATEFEFSRPRFGFCVLNFLSILSDFLS